ncbi:MAG: polysaccharide biosynthesis/export family protein [Planctomycetota bacterium]
MFPSVRALRRSLRLPTLLMCLPSCAFPGGPPIQSLAEEINATAVRADVLVVPGDELAVRFVYKTDWNHEALVLADGTATFQVVGTMPVAGLSVTEVASRLQTAYSKQITNAELSVAVKTPAARTVSVLGEVARPGVVPIPPDGHLTLVQAIAIAGGQLKASAHTGSTLLVRWDAAHGRQIAWTIDARPKHWGEAQTVFLQPYDVVYIPNTPIDEVDIWVDNYIRRLIPVPFVWTP